MPVNAIKSVPWELYCKMQSLGLEICRQHEVSEYLGAMTVQSTSFDHIIKMQLDDLEIVD